jgi:ubiquinone/menaquinone biosynthesis C-methylase UbiE
MDDWRSYDRVAEAYERIHAPRLAGPARDLAALLRPGPGDRLLDVGTGTGVAAAAALEASGGGALVVGVDVSRAMLAVARGDRPGIRLVQAEVVDLPFPDATFHGVLGNFVLSHVRRYETALHDMVRVLRPGGRLAVSNWGPIEDDLDRTWRSLVEEVVPPAMLRSVLGEAVPWEQRFADRAALAEALGRAGLRRVRTEVREYRFRYSLREYLEGRATSSTGRFVRGMLGEAAFGRFLERARDAFSSRFADPLTDFRQVVLAVGTKP